MRVRVERNGQVLLERVDLALTGWQRLRGLMLRRSLSSDEGLLLPDCASVHTCLMRFPIDLAYLDGTHRVVKLVPALKPWRVSACRGARAVLEMAAGKIEAAGLREGDRLLFES